MKFRWYRLTALLLACMLCGVMAAEASSLFGSTPIECAFNIITLTLRGNPSIFEQRESDQSNKLSIILTNSSANQPASITVTHPHEDEGYDYYMVWTELTDDQITRVLDIVLDAWSILESVSPEGQTILIQHIDDYSAYVSSSGKKGCTTFESADDVEFYLQMQQLAELLKKDDTNTPSNPAAPTSQPRPQVTGSKRCTNCGGDGEISENCSTCRGEGATRCSSCYGEGKYRCTSCYGDDEYQCTACRGQGCSSCSYRGDKRCSNCSGRGYKECGVCHGEGEKRCHYCSGSGKKTSWCSRCGGDGEVD